MTLLPLFLRSLRWGTAAASTGLLVVLGAVALLPAADARAMVVTSGSMAPAIDAGDAVVVRAVDPADVRVDDVITFARRDGSGLTTHRVLAVRKIGGVRHFQTQGDANDTPDVDLAPAAALHGRVVGRVPGAGRAIALLASRAVVVATVIVPAVWLAVAEVWSLLAPAAPAVPGPRRRRRRRRGAPRLGATTVVILALIGVLQATTSSGATLTDAAPVDANTFTTSASW